MHNYFSFLLLYYFSVLLLLDYYHNYYYHYSFISGSSNSSSSSSTSSSIIIIIIIVSSSSINNISELIPVSTSICEHFPAVLHQCTSPLFLRDYNGNKVTQLFYDIPAIAHFFTTVYFLPRSILMNLYLLIIYVVNIRFICDGEIYLLTLNSQHFSHLQTQKSF